MWLFVNLKRKQLDHHTVEINILIDIHTKWKCWTKYCPDGQRQDSH